MPNFLSPNGWKESIHQTFLCQTFLLYGIPYTIYHSNIRIDWRSLATILLVFLQASIANKASSVTGRSVKSQTLYAIMATVFSSYSNLPLGFLQIHPAGLKWCFYCCNNLSYIATCSHFWTSQHNKWFNNGEPVINICFHLAFHWDTTAWHGFGFWCSFLPITQPRTSYVLVKSIE